jgi:iron complex transport system substrate-binding protein
MQRSNAPLALVAALILISLLLAACGPVPAGTPPPSAITLTDARGRTVEFETAPERIVVAGRSSLTIINTLYLFPEARDRVVGLVVGKQKAGSFLSLVDDTFGDKAVLEVDAGPEQIAPLKPDVVITRSFMADKLGQPLEEIGIPVVYVDLETPEQYLRDVATLGRVLDNPGRAGEIQTYYQDRLDRVAQGVEGLDQAPSVLLVQISDQGAEATFSVPAEPWIQTTQVQLAGGEPVWLEAAQGGGWTVVNFEQIAVWDPDAIFVISYQKDSAQVADDLHNLAGWRDLKAVETGRLFGFGSDIYSWDQPDPRWILGLTWLAGKLHPDRFPDSDPTAEAVQFFEELYGMDEATLRDSIVPALKGDLE